MAPETLTQIVVFLFGTLMLIIISYDLITFDKLKSMLYSVAICKQCGTAAKIFCSGVSCNTPYCRTCYNEKAYCIMCKSNSVRPLNPNDYRITSIGYSIIFLGGILLLSGLYIDLSSLFSIKELVLLTRLTIVITSFFPLSVGLKKLIDLFTYRIRPLLSS